MCFNDTATTEIYTLSLHDALPISRGLVEVDHHVTTEDRVEGAMHRPRLHEVETCHAHQLAHVVVHLPGGGRDRKSTRLNSSHANISYAVFCLKKKKIVCAHNGTAQ